MSGRNWMMRRLIIDSIRNDPEWRNGNYIKQPCRAINSADDERNPPELGLPEREIKRVKNGRALLIPASDQTAGHGTSAQARFRKQKLADLPCRGCSTDRLFVIGHLAYSKCGKVDKSGSGKKLNSRREDVQCRS